MYGLFSSYSQWELVPENHLVLIVHAGHVKIRVS